ncbi:MAG: IPT/TIG domain-containing protein [Acidobacteriota bacterium]
MKSDRKPVTLVTCLVLLSLAVAQGSDHRTRLSKVRSVSLPSSAILDEHAQPLIASSGKVGFVGSVTGGSLISFSVTSGKILSSVHVGETLGAISIIETAGRRLIAVPAVNDPSSGSPATISIIDASSAKRLELKSLLVLPGDAGITAATGAVLTRDGRFCLIASSFDLPTLYSFDVETGELASHLTLIGRPSEIALYDDGTRRTVALASAPGNNLSVIRIDDQGALTSCANFSPSIARFDEANNPAFSSDGTLVYIAASTGDRLFAIDSESGIIIDSISIPSPERITVATRPDGIEMIAATRIRRPANGTRGGVTVLANQDGRLVERAEFTPPEGVEFSLANNVAFTGDASIAFVGSTTGMLFAFNTETGELESYQEVGSELRRIALSEKAHSVAAVRSAPSGDEVAIINFDVVGPDETDPSAPMIGSVSPGVVEQGRLRNLKLVVAGKNFTEGSSVIVNGVEMGADLVRRGTALETRLPKALFDQVAPISVLVKGANGALSQPTELRVVRPGAPMIDRISPTAVAGPSTPFTLRITGRNFRASSTVVVAGRPLNTQQIGTDTLQAVVPADIADTVRADGIKVQVKDLAVPDLVSANEKELHIFGPRVTDLKTTVGTVVAGGRSFGLTITGYNFREGAQVELRVNGEVFTAVEVQRLGSKAIKLAVPTHIFQESGNLAVVVRNPDGSESESRALDVRAPEITSFAPGKVFAGSSKVRIDILGKSFRRHARVYVGNARIENKHVRFRSSSHLIVTLSGDLNRLLEKPDTLRFQVVNPNDADGVPSGNKGLSIVGPEIADASVQPMKGDATRARVVIRGANFRRSAIVEFFKVGMEDAPVIQKKPRTLKRDRLIVVVPAKKLERMGSFRVRVVNAGTVSVASAFVRPRQSEVASSDNK